MQMDRLDSLDFESLEACKSYRECATTIVAEFGHLKPAELDSLNNALIIRCPAVANKRDLLQELLGE